MRLASQLDDEARRRAVTELGTTFLVEAGAGTGKTAVLISRLLALLCAGRGRLDRIAAVTFSDKSATEMRLRLRAELEIRLANSLSEDERANLRTARLQFDRAQISTVHAFCAALLRERPIEARVDPDFTVIDQFGANLLRAETWQEWLAHEVDRGSAVFKQALRAGLTLEHLETLRDFLVEQRDCLDWLDAPVLLSLDEFRTVYTNSVAQLTVLKNSCRTITDRALKAINTLEAAMPKNDDAALWERLFCKNLQALMVGSAKGVRANWRPATVLEHVRALLQQVGEVYVRTRLLWSHNLTVGLARWLEGYLQVYAEKKQERSQLDFVDLLMFTRDLLKSNLAVRGYFQRKFDFLLIDEFQDTDPLQAEIVFLLAEREPQTMHWATVALQPGKLFLVGDPQQSIYRFRRADLDVYDQVRSAIKQQGEVLSLCSNFRTREPVLTWINQTFARAFADVEGEQPVYRPLTATRQKDTGREVIQVPVPADLLSPHPTREELRRAEARTIAAFFKQTIGDGDFTVWKGHLMHYRDVAILFRTYQAVDAYEDALRDVGVPYRVYGGRRYGSRQEIEELRVLLLAVERPTDPSTLVAALRSSLFGFSDEELAQFVSAGGKFDALASSVPTALPTAADFTAALTLLQELHTSSAQESPATLLYHLYTHTHLIPLFALRPQGNQRVANLFKLIDIARTLATRGLNTLVALNRFLARREIAEEEEEAFLTEEDDDAVRLLTIHKAKGLEFPVVVLADMASDHNKRAGRTGITERATRNLQLQVGPRTLTCTTLGWQKAEAREQVRKIDEEWRLRYVAAARARDHLIVPFWPRAEKEIYGEPGRLRDNNEDSLGDFFPFDRFESARVYTYRNDLLTTGQKASPTSPVSIFARVSPEPTVLHAYEKWEMERRVLLEKGKQAALPFERLKNLTSSSSPQLQFCLRKALPMALREEKQHKGRASKNNWKTIEKKTKAEYLLENLLTSSLFTRAQAATECFVGLPFALYREERCLEGKIDLAFIEHGEWIVGAVLIDEESEAEGGEDERTDQAYLFVQALALEELTKRRVRELVVVSVPSQKEQRIIMSEKDRAFAQATLQILPHAVDTEQ